MVRNLLKLVLTKTMRLKEERGIKIGAGTVEIKIPFINKAIALDKDDINEFKEMLSKIQQ